MKTRSIFALLICAALPMMLHAQQVAKKAKPGCGCGFSSINQVGLLEGSGGHFAQLQTINGFRYRTWFTGLGIGLDYYHYRSVPLFIDVRKDLFNKPNTPFFYGDAGIHIPWVLDKQKPWAGRADYNNGFYYDAGLGYSFNLGKSRALLFSGGVSLKKIRETRIYDVVCITFPCPMQTERYDFSFKRFSLKAGLRL
ncbi:MAG TPA: hypothetical protein VEB42_03625 [Chitinophagaceae bacterium]|nr:hypothetical protein [Chitinophagaceae bacterium]